MATYTDNYQLTKPTYAEQADIGVINSNMNKIDDIMHSSQVSLAPAYDQSQTYAEGDVVMYELLMYKCISPTTGVWDGSKWERTTASESTGGGSAELDILGEASGAVASFADGASAGLAKCIAEIVPKQDLHGYSKPWAGGAGVNQWDEVWEVGAIGANSGRPSSYSNRIRSVNFCPCSANTNYFAFIGFDVPLRIFWYRTDYSYISYSTGGAVVTSPADAAFFKVSTEGTTYGETYRNDIAVNNPSTVTTYSPYANICPISGHSSVTINVSPTNDTSQGVDTTIQLGDTYYGGTLDVTRGILNVTHATTDVNTVITNRTTSYSNPVFYGEISGMKAGSQTVIAEAFNGIASKLSAQSFANNSDNGDCANNSNNTQFFIRADEYTDVPSLKTDLGTTKIQYELATPITVQLPPTTINTLLGQNYISSEDTGDIDIVYVKASAPIQPNPTGTPTATLKKLGIEGTVFEIPSGGGGSSSGINYSTTEQVIGTWIDGKPLYQKTVVISSLPSNTSVTQQYPHNIDSIGEIVNHDVIATWQSGSTVKLPYAQLTSGQLNSIGSIDCNINKTNIEIRVGTDRSNMTAYATIQYTKITD